MSDTETSRAGLARWHEVIRTRDTGLLTELLADDVVFHSPVVHTPQEGRDITTLYLAGANQVLNNGSFRYVRELVDGEHAMLEFVTEIDGIEIDGIDLITFDGDGRIVDFKVFIRPAKAFDKVRDEMAKLLAG